MLSVAGFQLGLVNPKPSNATLTATPSHTQCFRFGSFEIFKATDAATGRAGPSAGREVEMLPRMVDYGGFVCTIWLHTGLGLISLPVHLLYTVSTATPPPHTHTHSTHAVIRVHFPDIWRAHGGPPGLEGGSDITPQLVRACLGVCLGVYVCLCSGGPGCVFVWSGGRRQHVCAVELIGDALYSAGVPPLDTCTHNPQHTAHVYTERIR